MITVKYDTAFSPDPFLISRGIDPDKALFFDIETTGLKADYSHLYLIGACTRKSSGSWVLTQWLGEKPQEEAALLRTFQAFSRPYTTLVHFNGNHFDIPYLIEKENKYGLDPHFAQMESEDIYLNLRPLRKLLKMAHMNQKALEVFMGTKRADPYDGGELIGIYRNWIKDEDPGKLEAVLLHNKEDVEGMALVMGMYPYLYLTSPSLFTDRPGWHAALNDEELVLTMTLPTALPRPLTLTGKTIPAFLSASEKEVLIHVPLCGDELRYFFPNWRDYYYLPVEDQAIHKSVALSVDSSYRRKATPATCYVKKKGFFLPQPVKTYEPAFKKAYEDRIFYFEATGELISDPVFADDYAGMLIPSFMENGK